MFVFYRIAVGLLFYGVLPVLLPWALLRGRHRRGLLQRLALYPRSILRVHGKKTVWLHASSVGEIQAARAVIGELKKRLPSAQFIVTTMTIQGKAVAERQLDADVICLFAPLDVPFVVERSIATIRPDIYICIETELWPLLLQALSRHSVPIYLVNGRMSERSYRGYMRMRWLFGPVVGFFTRMVVISEADRQKYLALGAGELEIAVEGNVKYDLSLPDNAEELIDYYRRLLALDGHEVFIAGSTHTGEEELLLELYRRWNKGAKILFIVAPRHIERVPELQQKFHDMSIDHQLLSRLQRGERRRNSLLLVDTMGELAHLYAVADFVFCGGSLVKRGGHNLMEAALRRKIVFFGPSIDDFRDGAQMLESAGAGFRVNTVAELEEKLRYFRNHPSEYRRACRRAGEVATMQQGSSQRQIAFLFDDRGLRNRPRR